jgi:hypothetical protein
MADRPNICLAVIFNHRYEDNLPKLDTIYRGRFDDVRYLIPFYRGSRPDVIPVYDSSVQFQGYIAQAARSLIHPKYSHYVFVADDLLLNPELNAGNLVSTFRLDDRTGYVKDLNLLSDTPLEWPHFFGTLHHFDGERHVLYEKELPDRKTAFARFESHGLPIKDITWKNLRGYNGWGRYPNWRRDLQFMLRRRGRVSLRYPIVMGYSDLVIVPQSAIAQFCHICGIFAAMRLFAEIAIPTAMALSCERVMRRPDVGRPTREIWSEAQVEELSQKADYQINRVFSTLGNDLLYVHPIKLSKWKTSQ